MGRGNYKKKTSVVEVVETIPETINIEPTPETVAVQEVSTDEPINITIPDTPMIIDETHTIKSEIPSPLYRICILGTLARKYAKPDITSETVGFITDNSLYDIYSEKNGFGELKNNVWILLNQTQKFDLC